jgi:hypothetical protein
MRLRPARAPGVGGLPFPAAGVPAAPVYPSVAHNKEFEVLMTHLPSLRRPVSFVALTLLLAAGVLPAIAAQRMVLAEDFTTTWCVHCPYAGRALNQLIIAYPSTFTFIQEHGSSDTYRVSPFEPNRETFYGITGYPTVEFDGMIQDVGSYDDDTAQFNWYKGSYTTRKNTPTDVSIQLTATGVGSQTYEIHAIVAVDAGGASRTMRIYIANVLDNFPASTDHHYRNCLRAVATTQDVTLAGGEDAEVVRTFTFDSTSWAHQSDIRIIAWAQVPNSSGDPKSANIYNAAVLFGPLTPPPAMGDVNCDGAVNAFDIDPFIKCLISDAPTAPCTTCSTADIDENDDINAFDIDPFVQCVVNGGCP